MTHHALSTLYQLHIHPTRKGHRPTPTHSTAHPVGYRTRGTTTAIHTHQDANHSNLARNLGSHGTGTRIQGGTRTPHTETNWQTPPGSSAQIRLLLQNGQEMAHRAHSTRHTAAPNRRNITRPEPLCGRPNIRRKRVPTTNTETCTTPHMEHLNPNIRGVPEVPAGTKEQISRTRWGTTAPAPAPT